MSKIITIGIALILWTTLPVWTLLGPEFEDMELVFTNAGFMVMAFDYVRTTIVTSKSEHVKLLKSEAALRDINEKLAEKVKERTEKLEQVNERILNTFINLAHEAKTPLTLVNNYLEDLVSDKEITKKEELRIIKGNVEALTKGIVNFFDLERFKRGFFAYDHKQGANLSKVIKDAAAVFTPFAERHQISLNAKIEDEVFIQADPEAINRVVNNLVDNAIKYNSPNGVVEITLSTISDHTIVTIKNKGEGIPSDQLQNIFEPYFQLGQKKKNSKGMGLGLSIVKKIMESLPAEIVVNSSSETGTEFKLTFSRYDEVVSAADYQVKPSAHLVPEIKDAILDEVRPAILIIEDNAALLQYMIMKLKERFNIYAATNGAQALEKLKKIKTLDLILSDIMMDVVDGYEFLRLIHENQKFAHIPFIFITAKSESEKPAALFLGAVDYIQKPFRIGELIHKIDALLNMLQRQRQAVIDQAYKNLLTVDNNKLQHNFGKFNLTNREKEIIQQIKDGASYREISQSLFISEKTVAKHIQNIYQKLSVSSKTEMINKIYA